MVLIDMYGYKEHGEGMHGGHCKEHGEGMHGEHGRRGFMGEIGFRGLRHYVLELLNEKPMKGSEIMAAISEKTMDRWKPSPGSIYPLLRNLESLNLVTHNENGSYSITEAGKQEISYRREVMRGFGGRWAPNTIEDMINEMENYVNYFSDVPEDAKSNLDALTRLAASLDRLLEKLKSKEE
jgi:DNA-binding PadR family transcriptional regulator